MSSGNDVVKRLYQKQEASAAGCGKVHMRLLFLTCCTLLFFLCPVPALPVNFSINPVKIFLDGKSKTNVLKIKNHSDEKISLQVRTFTWEHDRHGRNDYTPTRDIIFFPKILTIQKNEEKIIRIGTNIPQSGDEKTYRMFLEEIPPPDSQERMAVRMIMKIGVPVFVSPHTTVTKGRIESMSLHKGDLHLTVKNTGNVHFLVQSVRVRGTDVSGKELYSTEIGGWYLHGGKEKEYTVEIPEEHCRSIAHLQAHVTTDILSMSKKLNVAKEMCKP